MKCRSLLLLSLALVGCAARSPRLDSPLTEGARALDATTSPALDATEATDATAERGDRSADRAWGALQREGDAGLSLPAPRTFGELIEREVPVYWRTQSARGVTCTQWTPGRAGAQGQQRVLRASVTVRCVETTASVNVNVRADDLLELNGLGGGVSSRTGGSGWMRVSSSSATRVQWIESDELRVLTSEGPWFFDRLACEQSSAELATSPTALPPDRAPHESVRAARDLAELRWLIASFRSQGAPPAMVAAVTALFRPGAALWEPDVDRRSCRRWNVQQDRPLRARLTRELPGARGPRGAGITEQQWIEWSPACAELALIGCARLMHGPGVGGGQSSSYEGRVSVDEATTESLSVGQLRVFASREACVRSSARQHGPLFTACDR